MKDTEIRWAMYENLSHEDGSWVAVSDDTSLLLASHRPNDTHTKIFLRDDTCLVSKGNHLNSLLSLSSLNGLTDYINTFFKPETNHEEQQVQQKEQQPSQVAEHASPHQG